MADEDDRIQRLELRLERIEQALTAGGGAAKRQSVSDVSPEELQAFVKVRDVLAGDWGDFCGVNDCFRCIALCRPLCTICRVCRVCDVECSCGPCNIGGGGLGGLSRFSGLGG